MQAQKQLFPRDLGRQAAQRRIGNLVFRIVPGSGRGVVREPGLEIPDPVAGERRNHEGGVEPRARVGVAREREQLRSRHQVDLVDDQDFRLPRLGETAQDRLGLVVEAAARVDQQRRPRRHRARRPRPSPPWRARAGAWGRRCRECRSTRAGRSPRSRSRARARAWSAPCGSRSRPWRPTSAFTSVDLPTLGAPIRATKPQRGGVVSPDRATAARRRRCRSRADRRAGDDRSSARSSLRLLGHGPRLSVNLHPRRRRPRARASRPRPPARRLAWSGRSLRPARAPATRPPPGIPASGADRSGLSRDRSASAVPRPCAHSCSRVLGSRNGRTGVSIRSRQNRSTKSAAAA